MGSNMSYEFILFDLDGTLTDSMEGITKCVQYSLHYFGIEVQDRKELLPFIGPSLYESFRNFYQFDDSMANKAVEKYRERFSNIGIFENKVYEGIPEMLKKLCDEGYTLAVATSKPEVYANRVVEKYDLKQYFNVVVGSELDGLRSKKAEVIQEVFQRLTIDQEQKKRTVMVGDRSQDIIGAKTCCIPSIGVKYGYAHEHELELAGADFVVETVSELQQFLLESL